MPGSPLIRFREVAPAATDADWAGTQVTPDAGATIELDGLYRKIGVVVRAYDGGGSLIAGTVDLQPVVYGPEIVGGVKTETTVVGGGAVDPSVPIGSIVEIGVSRMQRVAIRLVGASAPVLAAARLVFAWTVLE